MMSHTVPLPKPTHWAVLIGVGFTIDAQSGSPLDGQILKRDSSLKGAVADIDLMESYFQDDVRVKVTKLTATKPSDEVQTNLPLEPLEPPEKLPTRDNVISALKTVIKEGADGHIKHVYIHFSGHGTRMPDQTLALSLYKGRLLTEHLVTALNRMAKQGMHVTLVLDCCFSGSMKRAEEDPSSQVRFIDYDSQGELSDLDNPFLETELGQMRHASLNTNSIWEPDGFTVIAACGSNENAWEVEVAKAKRHGILSYFLHTSLVALKHTGENISFQTLCHHLQAKFHANYPRQTPRHYGSLTDCFFQHISCDLGRYLTTAYRIPGGDQLVLKAGEAHGVHQGDIYEAYPYYASEADIKVLRQNSVLLQVQAVDSLQSEVLPVNKDDLERFKKVTTWKAEPVSSQSQRKTSFHITTSLSTDEQAILQKDVSRHPFLQFWDQEKDIMLPTFYLTLTENGSYEIHDGNSDRVTNAPVIAKLDANSLNCLSTVLGHLATFKFFEGIENGKPDKCFEDSVCIETSCKLESDGWYEIKDGANFDFSITNFSTRPLYLAVFNLRSSWQICNMMAEAQAGSFHELESTDEKATFPITMQVPEEVKRDGGKINEDIMKIFITDQPPHFPFEILPKLGDGASRDTSGPRELVRCLESLERGYWDMRQTEQKEQGHWTTRNFLIRTCLP